MGDSTVTGAVTFPSLGARHPGSKDTLAPARRTERAHLGESMRVLVVEDHKRLAEAVASGLRDEGMAVDLACDGQEALDHVAVARYDVIVLDRDLPGVHGDRVCRDLAERRCRGQC